MFNICHFDLLLNGLPYTENTAQKARKMRGIFLAQQLVLKMIILPVCTNNGHLDELRWIELLREA